PTAALAPDPVLRRRACAAQAARLAAYCDRRAPSSGLFQKSSQDSSGNVSAIVSSANFAERAPAFAAAVRRWLLAVGFDDPA
ncbi:glutathione synthetase, partial [Burkholderia pseudomallei]